MKIFKTLSVVIISIAIVVLSGYLFQIGANKGKPVGAAGNYYNSIGLLDAVTATATSSKTVNINGAKRATFYFSRGDTTGTGNSGSSVFTIQVAETGSDWIYYNKLIDNVTNANSEQLTRVGSVTLPAGTSTKMYSMDLTSDNLNYVRCISTEATDGEATCSINLEY